MTRSALAGALVATLLFIAPQARATDVDCDPASGISTCIDSENLWFAPGATRFFGIPRAGSSAPGFGYGMGLSYM